MAVLLALGLPHPESRGFGPAADAELLPELEPGAVREPFVMPAIGGRDIACGERPDVRRFEHFPQLLDVVNDALNVHAFPSCGRRRGAVKRK